MNEPSQRVLPPGQTQAGVLDPVTLQGLQGLGGSADPDLFSDLVEIFLDEAGRELQSMERAWDRMELDAVVSGAGALRTASATIGTPELSVTCKEPQSSTKSGAADLVSEGLIRCREAFERAEEALRAMAQRD